MGATQSKTNVRYENGVLLRGNEASGTPRPSGQTLGQDSTVDGQRPSDPRLAAALAAAMAEDMAPTSDVTTQAPTATAPAYPSIIFPSATEEEIVTLQAGQTPWAGYHIDTPYNQG